MIKVTNGLISIPAGRKANEQFAHIMNILLHADTNSKRLANNFVNLADDGQISFEELRDRGNSQAEPPLMQLRRLGGAA